MLKISRESEINLINVLIDHDIISGKDLVKIKKVSTEGNKSQIDAVFELKLTDEAKIVDVLDHSVLLPQVGQGALAIECRVDEPEISVLLSEINHLDTHRSVMAERAFLSELGTGCDLPIAAHAITKGDDVLLTAALSSHDGKTLLRTAETGKDGLVLGKKVAHSLLDIQAGRQLMEKNE